MKTIFNCIILLLLSTTVFPKDKKNFDIDELSGGQSALVKTSLTVGRELSNEWLEATMLSGAYFTIGTSNGRSALAVDDKCAISFGHPYALTSHPVISVDGTWRRLDEYFKADAMASPVIDGNSLSVSASNADFEALFSITLNAETAQVDFRYQVSNIGSESRDVALGIVFDPALGKWGDGHLKMSETAIERDTVILSPAPLTLWEKKDGAKGIGIAVSFPDRPAERMLAANWPDLYNNASPDYQPGFARGLYDLDLKFYWQKAALAPGQNTVAAFNLALVEPDFSGAVFLRWDMPGFFALPANQMFPREFKTYMEIVDLSGGGIQNAMLEVTPSPDILISDTNYPINNLPKIFSREIAMQSNLVYDDKIESLQAELIFNGEIADIIRKNVFIPATPVSETGLRIIVDSVNVANSPDIELIFSAEIEESDRRILDLGSENVLLYESGERIEEFNFAKTSIGGASSADVVFVLDISHSMGDEIEQVRQNLTEFGASLQDKGYDFQIGVVTFSTTVDDVWDFTNDIELIKQRLAGISLWGGVEDSPSALYRATELSFRLNSRRTIIWITDEPYPETNYTKQQIVNRMLGMGISVHGVGLDELQTDWFNPIVLPTGGNFYNINGNFRDILLDITNIKAQDLYSLIYRTNNENSEPREVVLALRYAGLGGKETFIVTPESQLSKTEKRLHFYPNPFNPAITFEVDKTGFSTGKVQVYNIIGQLVREFNLNGAAKSVVWNARNSGNRHISSGFYIVRLALQDINGRKHNESARVLYLK